MNNNRPLFFASFMTLIAAGFGFAVRSAILGRLGTSSVHQAGARHDHGRWARRRRHHDHSLQHRHRSAGL